MPYSQFVRVCNLEEFFFGVNLDGAVTLGVGNAGEDESFGHLVVVWMIHKEKTDAGENVRVPLNTQVRHAMSLHLVGHTEEVLFGLINLSVNTEKGKRKV